MLLKAIGFALSCWPFIMVAQENLVPTGVAGNQLVLVLKNAYSSTIRDVHVTIGSAPAWIDFKSSVFVIDSIAANDSREAVFEFRAMESRAEPIGEIALAVTTSEGEFLGRRITKIRTTSQPQKSRLLPPYPNPGNPGTTIRYAVHATSIVKLEIYDILGKRIRVLIHEGKPAGTFVATWDGKNDRRVTVPSGTYLVRLITREIGKNIEEQSSTKITIRK